MKGILEKIVNQKLGKYIKTLSKNQIQTDLFGGEVTMTDIQLNHNYFNQKNHLFQIDYSSIDKLFIQAPITKLSNTPVTLSLQNVFILLKFKTDKTQIKKEQILVSYVQKMFAKMLQKIKQEKSDEGYVGKVINRVIDNLVIKILNIHIRFQELNGNKVDLTNKKFATGITLQELSLKTTDQSWKIKFLDRYQQKNQIKSTDIIHKLVELQKLTFYWQSLKDNSQSLCLMKSQQKKKAMLSSIKNEKKLDRVNLIQITSSAKLKINSKDNLKDPRFILSIDLQPILMHLKNSQIPQILYFVSQLLQKNKQNLQKKALKQITHAEQKVDQILYQKIIQTIISQQDQYISAQKVAKIPNALDLIKSVSLEKLLKIAPKFIKKQINSIKQKQIKKKNKGWFSKEKQLTKEEKQQLAKVIDETFLQNSVKRPGNSQLLKVNLNIQKTSITLQNLRKDKVEMLNFDIINIQSELNLSEDLSHVLFAGSINRVEIVYLGHKKMVILQSFFINQQKSLIQINFQKKLTQKNQQILSLKSKIQKIFINYEPSVIKRLIEISNQIQMSSGNLQIQKSLKDHFVQKNDKKQQQFSLKIQMKSIFQVQIDIISPLIIIPINQKQYLLSLQESHKQINRQCWILDLGSLIVRTKNTQNSKKRQQSFQLALQDFSMKYYKHFQSKKYSVENTQCNYSLINPINIQGKVLISPNKIDLIILFPEFSIKICQEQYTKFMRLIQILIQRHQSVIKMQRMRIQKNKKWCGQLKKKQYTIVKGYTYKQYWAIIDKEHLYFYKSKDQVKYFQKVDLRHSQIKQSHSDNKSQAKSDVSSVNSQNESTLYLKVKEKTYHIKSHEIQAVKKILHDNIQALKSLNKIVQEYIEQDEFEEFDDDEEWFDVKQDGGQSVIKVKSSKIRAPKKQQSKIVQINHVEISVMLNIKYIGIIYESQKAEVLIYSALNQISLNVHHIKNTTKLSFSLRELIISDKIYEYNLAEHQHLICTEFIQIGIKYEKINENFDLIQSNYEENSTYQIKQKIDVDLKANNLQANWKPDIILLILDFYTTNFKKFSQVNKNSRISQQNLEQPNISTFFKQNQEFSLKRQTYLNDSIQAVKKKRDSYIIPSENENIFRIRLNLEVKKFKVNFFHRQSHIHMFKFTGEGITQSLVQGRNAFYVQGNIKNLSISQTSGYPKKAYSQDSVEEHYEILSKSSKSSQPIISFKFAKYDSFSFPNLDQVDSFLKVQINPITFIYFQQTTLRLVDYCLIQIMMLLTEHELLTVNQGVNQQLKKLKSQQIQINRSIFQKQTVKVLFSQYEDLLKKVLLPFFIDISVSVKKPTLILKSTKTQDFCLKLVTECVQIQNFTKIQPNRIHQKHQSKLKELQIFEQHYTVELKNCQLVILQKGKHNIFSENFEGLFKFRRLLFQNELTKLYPNIRFIQDYICEMFIPSLTIPKLSRNNFMNLLKLANFNITFDDGCDERFVHNYQVTKFQQPKCIQFKLLLQKIQLLTTYEDSKKKLNLMKMDDQNNQNQKQLLIINANNLEVLYFRDKFLDGRVQMNFKQFIIDGYDPCCQNNDSIRIPFVQYKKYGSVNKNIVDVFMKKIDQSKQIYFQISNMNILLNTSLAMINSQWFVPQNWVFPVQPQMNNLIDFTCKAQNIVIYIPDVSKSSTATGFKLNGSLSMKYLRKATSTLEFVQDLFLKGFMDKDQIEAIGENTIIGIDFYPQIFFYRTLLKQGVKLFDLDKSQIYQRRIIQKTLFKLTESKHYRIRKNPLQSFRGSMIEYSKALIVKNIANTNLILENSKMKFAFVDILMFQNMLKIVENHLQVSNRQIKKFKHVRNDESKKTFLEKLEQVEESPRQNINIQILDYSLLIYNVKFQPIMKFYILNSNFTKKRTFKSDEFQVVLSMEGLYFNHQIFKWEPFLQQNVIKINIQNLFQQKNKQQAKIIGQVNVYEPLRINISRVFMISLNQFQNAYQKSLNKISIKSQNLTDAGFVQNFDSEKQFISHYIIKNDTGYPIEIYNDEHELKYIIMTSEEQQYQVEEIKISKKLQMSTINQHNKTTSFGFKVLHDKFDLLAIRGISMDSESHYKIRIKTVLNKFLPPQHKVQVTSQIKNCRKYISIKSTKFIEDYSSNILKKTYLPFDHEGNIFLKDPQKIQISLYDKEFNKKVSEKSQFQYIVSNGTLKIKKPYLVYNYTPIPLQVCDMPLIPGQFIGISKQLTIQGFKYNEQDSIVKVIKNQKQRQFYLYSPSYIIDYFGLQFQFRHSVINKYFSFQLMENNRKITIYLLPEVNYEFQVKFGKQQGKVCLGNIGKEMITLRNKNSEYEFSVNSYLQSYHNCPVKQLKKIVEVTQGWFVSNNTQYNLHVRQKNCEKGFNLKPKQQKQFYWPEVNLPKQLQITIVDKDSSYDLSGIFSKQQSQGAILIPHKFNKKNSIVLSSQMHCTQNINYWQLQEPQAKYFIQNQVPDSIMKVFQIQADSKRHSLIFSAKYQQKIQFGYESPLNDKTCLVYFQFTNDSQFKNWISFPIRIPDLQTNLFSKDVELVTHKNKKIQRRILKLILQINGKCKKLKFSLKQKHIKKDKVFSIMAKIPTIYFSLIGIHEFIRKELIVCIVENTILQIEGNHDVITYNMAIWDFRIENTLKYNPLYTTLFQPNGKSLCFINFMFSRSMTNRRLIHYLGFSMGQALILMTSDELECLLQNFDKILNPKTQNSDNFLDINCQKLDNPKIPDYKESLYFVEAQIKPIKVNFTFRCLNNWGGILGRAFGNINNCQLQIDGRKITHFSSPNLTSFCNSVSDHFKDGIKSQVLSIIGSVGLVSAPINFVGKIGSGFQDLVVLPAKGFRHGPLQVGKGLITGAGSLVKNTFEGAFGAVQAIGNTIGNGLSLIQDDEYNKKRSQIKNKRSDNVFEGVGHGAQSIFHGVSKGITGLITQPVKGASKGGIGGFFLGGLKGITGLVTKPVTGIIDAASKTAEGVKNTTSVFSPDERKKQIQRKYMFRPFYGAFRYFTSYDKNLAKWNKFLLDEDCKRFQNSNWIDCYKLQKGQKIQNPVILIMYENVIILDAKQNEICHQISSQKITNIQDKKISKDKQEVVLHCMKMQKQLKLVLKPIQKQKKLYEDLKQLQDYYNPQYFYEVFKETLK